MKVTVQVKCCLFLVDSEVVKIDCLGNNSKQVTGLFCTAARVSTEVVPKMCMYSLALTL